MVAGALLVGSFASPDEVRVRGRPPTFTLREAEAEKPSHGGEARGLAGMSSRPAGKKYFRRQLQQH
jgi:hypothetical protein